MYSVTRLTVTRVPLNIRLKSYHIQRASYLPRLRLEMIEKSKHED